MAPSLDTLKAQLETLDNLEEKLKKAIELMEASVAQHPHPDFKTFWETRRITLSILKTDISPVVKAAGWKKDRELVKEVRRLKDILEEQSAFAVEQIDLAIRSLEEKISQQINQHENPPILSPLLSKILKENQYQILQCQLNLLNTQAPQINALRKEVVKTAMRFHQKSQFFQRLSAMGDQVFPKRKELVKEVSRLFITDVKMFVAVNFSQGKVKRKRYILRDEIKAFQALAKQLTLNTSSFTEVQKMLRECWGQIKEEEKEQRKKQSMRRVSGKNSVSVQEKVIEENGIAANEEEDLLFNLPNDNQHEAINHLKEVLKRQQQRCSEIKDEVEKYRKASGTSGLDFNRSLYFNEKLKEGKDRLEKVNKNIQQVEVMIKSTLKACNGESRT